MVQRVAQKDDVVHLVSDLPSILKIVKVDLIVRSKLAPSDEF